MRHSISVEVNWNLQQWTTTEKNKVWQAPYPATMVLRHCMLTKILYIQLSVVHVAKEVIIGADARGQ